MLSNYVRLNISANSTFTKTVLGDCSSLCGEGVQNETTYTCKARSKSFYDCQITNVVSRICRRPSKCPGKYGW